MLTCICGFLAVATRNDQVSVSICGRFSVITFCSQNLNMTVKEQSKRIVSVFEPSPNQDLFQQVREALGVRLCNAQVVLPDKAQP